MNKKGRNSSLELLRIISMFFIVIHHYAFYGTFNRINYISTNISTFRINLMLLFFGKVAVDLFVLIGAYFLSEKRFNFKRPVNLGITTIVYSLSIFIFIKIAFPQLIWNHENWFQALFPFPSPTGYWFVDSYLFMLLLMPVLNLCLESFSLKKIKQFIVLLLILWSILPTFTTLFNYKLDLSPENFGYSSGTFFLLIYIISGFLRKSVTVNNINLAKESIILSLLIIISVAYISICSYNKEFFSLTSIMAYLFNPLALFLAISIFKCFLKLKFHNKIINYISGSMFGVYLLHENSFVRPFIWKSLFNSAQYSSEAQDYLIYGIRVSLAVFVICILIDIVFRRLILLKFINKLSDIVSNSLVKIVNDEEK
ncbi:acyltransferase [Lactobacillus sp. Marseille-P7033]|nr:acyltransferase [Lactobacillus sp. Marseille-P7033]NGC77339.1 acyltransferase family protein [Limosilactobacillus reuteri]